MLIEQLELVGDDGLLIPREFAAVAFAGGGYKSKYKLECDEKTLSVRPILQLTCSRL